MGLEERFTSLRLTAACVQLNREQITELVAITAMLIEERKRIRQVLEALPESFTEVRKLLNELALSCVDRRLATACRDSALQTTIGRRAVTRREDEGSPSS